MAQRRRSAQEPVQEPVKADEIVAEVSELDFIEVSEADVSENETFASEADSVTEEEEKAPIEAVSDESVVEETGEVNVTFSGMKDLQARVPNKIQVVIPLDGTGRRSRCRYYVRSHAAIYSGANLSGRAGRKSLVTKSLSV